MTGEPFIPEYITVHLGRPDSAAENVTVSFPDYIKNVASSEIYPTWPEDAIRANIYAQISFALNRVYTEWYRSRGYDFDITNSTAFDQSFVQGRAIFENISDIVDDIFNDYIRRYGSIEPLLAAYCSGRGVDCEGLKQWETVPLAEQGYTPYSILTHFYGDDISIVENAPVRVNSPSYPGLPLRQGSTGNDVQQLQIRLNRVSTNYPAIPKIANTDGIFGQDTEDAVTAFQRIFNLTPDGIVGNATWYRIAYLYTSVKRLAELDSEGISLSEVSFQYPQLLQRGDTGVYVMILQYFIAVIAQFYDNVPPIVVNGNFDQATENAVIAFQKAFGLTADGIVGRNTWNQMYSAYYGIVRDQQMMSGGVLPFPGGVLRTGSTGEYVTILQEFLEYISRTYTDIPPVTVDGIFGNNTDTAVRAFQSRFGLTPNGVVGAITWDAIAGVYSDLINGNMRSEGQFPGYIIKQEVPADGQ